MSHYLDLDRWNRKEHYLFFKDFELPFFNICADVEITRLLAHTKQWGQSSFLATLFLSLKAANAVENFRYRLRGDRVLVHDLIHGGSTVLNADETFSFCYFDFGPDFTAFAEAAAEVMERHKTGHVGLDPADDRDDLIHYSVIPWVSFTSFQHARRPCGGDSVPKIVFGKYRRQGKRVFLPVSVEVHHALADGLHTGRFFEGFQTLLNDPANMG